MHQSKGCKKPLYHPWPCLYTAQPVERSRQVALMRTIYSTARITICYIGPGGYSFTSKSAWNFLQRESEWVKEITPDVHKELEDAIDFRGNLDDVEDDILERPWFRRAWVLQEVVVSRWLILQSGARWVPWQDFCKTVLLSPRVHDRYGLSLSKRDLYSYVRNQFVCRCLFQEAMANQEALPSWYKSIQSEVEGEASSLDVLAYSRRLNATDQRDKIYALLGINPRLEFSDFPVDYTLDYEDVYLAFARYYISTIANFDILSHVDSHNVLRYHSWVPNWMQLPLVSRTISSILPAESTDQQARRKAHTLASQAWDETNAHRLSCQGEVVGTITWKSMSIQLNGAVEEIFEKLCDQYSHDEPELNMRILSKWEMFGYGTTDLSPVPQESRAFLLTSSREHVMRDLPEWATWPHYQAYRRTEVVVAEAALRNELKREWKLAKKQVKEKAKQELVEEDGGERVEDVAERDAHSSSDSDDDDLDEIVASMSLKPRFEAPLDERLRKPTGELGILEQHLLLRSHKTVEFSSDDGSKSVDVIIDRSSIIDQRCFAKYRSSDDAGDSDVALVPQAADVGDLIVAVHGARLPFVVREIVDDPQLHEEEAERLLANMAPRRHFQFIGECLFNDFELYDCVADAADEMPPYSTTLVFH